MPHHVLRRRVYERMKRDGLRDPLAHFNTKRVVDAITLVAHAANGWAVVEISDSALLTLRGGAEIGFLDGLICRYL